MALIFSWYSILLSGFENYLILVVWLIFSLLLFPYIKKFFSFSRKYRFLVNFSVALVLFVRILFLENSYNQSVTEFSSWVFSGEVVEIRWKNKIVARSRHWWQVLVIVDKKVELWEKLLFVGTFKWNEIQRKVSFDSLWAVSLIHFGEFDFSKRLFLKWYAGTFFAKSIIREKNSWKINQFLSLRKTVIDRITEIFWPTKEAWLLAGMVVWDVSLIPEPIYQNFIKSWIVHIVAVSWGNIALIVSFLSIVLFFLPFYLRFSCIGLFVICYALICWAEASVLRATIMASLSLFAIFFGRMASARRTLELAFCVMLLIQPFYLLFDLGFLLSFSAVYWILWLSQKISLSKNKLLSILQSYFLPIIWASGGVLPFLLIFIGSTNLFSIPANLLIAPLVPLVQLFSFLLVPLSFVFPPSWLLIVWNVLTTIIFWVSDIFSHYSLTLFLHQKWLGYIVIVLYFLLFLPSVSKTSQQVQTLSMSK